MPPKRKLNDAAAIHIADDDRYSSWDQFDKIFHESLYSQKIWDNPLASTPTPIRPGCDRAWDSLKANPVVGSHPLANMVAAVHELIDPDFDPFIENADETPRFLRPLPSRILPEDIEYLKTKGALDVPGMGLRKELLRCYVQWVHSFMPLLDLHEFLRGVAENDPNANISLLLFQAVMFAGTAFVDIKYLQEAGFATRRDARKAFFSRVRLLYSFDYEEDRIAILQAILLMTYWFEPNSSPQKDIWHWVGVCNTQAQSIGLHRDSTKSNMNVKTQRLRVRLWWTLYSRDRLIALALRRPTQISEGFCDVPIIKMDDFDIRPFHPAVINMLQCRQLEDISHQRHLAEMFIEKVKLCQCLGRVLFARYSPSNHDFGATHKTTITLLPRQASEAELDRCSLKLDAWVNGLSKLIKFYPERPNRLSDGDDVLFVHSAMLKMIYNATSSALHRPYTTSNSNRAYSSYSDRWKQTSLQKIHHAATGTAEIAKGLSQMDLTKFLPTSSVTVLLPAAIAHMTNFTSPNHTLRDESKWNFCKCVDVLAQLRDIYPAADLETANLEAALKLKFANLQNSIVIRQNAAFDAVGGSGGIDGPGIISRNRSPGRQDTIQLLGRRQTSSHIATDPGSSSSRGNVVELADDAATDDENVQAKSVSLDQASSSNNTINVSETSSFAEPYARRVSLFPQHRSQPTSPPTRKSPSLYLSKEVRDEEFYTFAQQLSKPGGFRGSPNHIAKPFLQDSVTPSDGDANMLQVMLGLANGEGYQEDWPIIPDSIDDEEGSGVDILSGSSYNVPSISMGSTQHPATRETSAIVITGDLERDLGI